MNGHPEAKLQRKAWTLNGASRLSPDRKLVFRRMV